MKTRPPSDPLNPPASGLTCGAWFRAALFGLILCISPWVWAQEGAPGPRISIPESRFDFGEVEEGRALEHTYRVLNKGNEPLEIKKVKPG